MLKALEEEGTSGLTVINNNLGEPGCSLGRLLLNGQIRKAIGSFFTSNPDVSEWHRRGDLEIALIPQGTMSEAIRAGGARIPAFYTKTGVGTLLAEGKEERVFAGERYLLQTSLHADFALIRAHKADRAEVARQSEVALCRLLKLLRDINRETGPER